MNLVVPILRHAAQQPDSIALTHDHVSYTYATLVQAMRRIANGLQQKGLRHDKIAILSRNRIEFVEVFLGAIYAGCVPIPLDPKWSANELQVIIEQCQPAMIFAEPEAAKNVVFKDQAIPTLTFSKDRTGSYDQWLDALNPEAELDETNELLFIGFTSGTTGLPKGYMRTHLSWLKSFEVSNAAFELDHMKDVLAPGPFVHSLSLFAVMQSLYGGANFHITQKFSATQVLELCKQIPGVVLFVVPTMLESMMQQAVPGQTQIDAIISSGAKWSWLSKKRGIEVFAGARLYESYGSSEASYISYLDVLREHNPNSVGKPYPGVQISIRDEQFREVPTGEIGQLYVRSDMIFLGYHQLPNETAAAFRDGWILLEDYVYQDETGYLYLAGRLKNRIITGGLNVYPEEIERVLEHLPEIQEVMVLGVPDDYWGEQLAVLVKWNDDKHLSIDEIKNYCRQYLASYKAPKQLLTVDEFIYTSSGKIARQAMKDYVKRAMV
ncbi:AMP-binding protein [Paenibacillus pseudetheri]|uniref:Acyl--CoA ligase YhfT n=1 Tax=Paenibacillus pseudetheri TaxID=2897682 RepID=A0ABN8FGH4_9BACL|nr:AMP-binding protein [Paenibacillus pseudetheri]CAH1054720.1 putative acyl--CoA ligase YhfT [Paenibacillus pseudetheri]